MSDQFFKDDKLPDGCLSFLGITFPLHCDLELQSCGAQWTGRVTLSLRLTDSLGVGGAN